MADINATREEELNNLLGSASFYMNAEPVRLRDGVAEVDAEGLHYRDLNALLRTLGGGRVKRVELRNVYGQRYVGTSLHSDLELHIYGTPGNDLGAFMNGPRIIVHGNVQDACGNTMDNGEIIVHGRAGDITGYGMRGGRIFIRDDAGYRVGIHMKEYAEKKPILVVGGTVQDFLGEYMAGGVLLVLGLTLPSGGGHKASYVGTGMHGGAIYIKGSVAHLGKEVGVKEMTQEDHKLVKSLAEDYCR
ncbi:MAG: hypothetical protein QW587_09875, partial [Candidatus Bathyarchaeia archaeon]